MRTIQLIVGITVPVTAFIALRQYNPWRKLTPRVQAEEIVPRG
jgi:hypothetical protein